MKYCDTVLQIFARAPVPGEVNTRLIPHIGVENATALQYELVQQRLASLVEVELCELQLWCTPDARHDFFTHCNNYYDIPLLTQKGVGLGERMSNAIHQGLADYKHVVLIGTDAPSLDIARIDQAIAALQQNDIVIVPAEDGGYVLIGMSRHYPEVFASVSWGSDRVMSQTLINITSLGLRMEILDSCWDIDRFEDYERYLALVKKR